MPHSAFDRARSGINALRIKSATFKIASGVIAACSTSFILELV